MEYLVVLVFIGAVLMIASHRLVGGYDGKEFKLGPIGRDLQGFYQRTIGGISLPIP